MTRHSNHSLVFDTEAEAGTPVVVGLLSQLGNELNSQVDAPQTGDPYDVATAIIEQSPQLPFATHALKSVLDLVGLTGKLIDSDSVGPPITAGLVAYAQKHDATGTSGRAAAGGHMSLSYSDGRILLESISVQGRGDAVLTGRAYGFTPDLDASPLAIAYNATLPASPVRDERYGMGKAIVEGTLVNRIVSVEFRYNQAIELIMDAGSIYPVDIDLIKFPTLTTIVTEDPTWLDPGTRINFSGNVAAHADTQIQWVRRTLDAVPVSGGGFQDYTATNHIQATLAGFIHVTDHYSASGQATGNTTIEIRGEEESGTAPVVFDTSAVHTTS